MVRPGVSHLNLIDGGLSLTDNWRYVACIHHPLGGTVIRTERPTAWGIRSCRIKLGGGRRQYGPTTRELQAPSETGRQRATSHVELALAPLKTSGAEFLRPCRSRDRSLQQPIHPSILHDHPQPWPPNKGSCLSSSWEPPHRRDQLNFRLTTRKSAVRTWSARARTTCSQTPSRTLGPVPRSMPRD